MILDPGMKTRAPKVVPLNVPLHILLIRHLYYIKDLYQGSPTPKGTALRVQGRIPRLSANLAPARLFVYRGLGWHIRGFQGNVLPGPLKHVKGLGSRV